jgi:hypothetical protein
MHFNLLIFVFSLYFIKTGAAQNILFPYKSGELYGYADINRNIVVEPQHPKVTNFTNNIDNTKVSKYIGMAYNDNGNCTNIYLENGKALFPINEQHKLSLFGCSSGLFSVTKYKNDKSQIYLFNANLDKCFQGEDVYFMCKQTIDYDFNGIPPNKLSKKENHWMYWNRTDLSPYTCIFTKDKDYRTKKGLFNPLGKLIIEPKFCEFSNVQNGVVLGFPFENLTLNNGQKVKSILELNAITYFDTTGKELKKSRYLLKPRIANGLIGALDVSNSNLWGFVNTKDEIVVPFKYQQVVGYFKGVGVGELATLDCDLLDSTGHVFARSISIDNIKTADNWISILQPNGRWKFYNYEGKQISPNEYKTKLEIIYFNSGYLAFAESETDSLFHLFDLNGKKLTEYKSLTNILIHNTPHNSRDDERRILLKINNKSTVYFWRKNIESKPYDKINSLFVNQFCIVEKDGKKGVIDTLCRELVPPIYDDIQIPQTRKVDDFQAFTAYKKGQRPIVFGSNGEPYKPTMQAAKKYLNDYYSKDKLPTKWVKLDSLDGEYHLFFENGKHTIYNRTLDSIDFERVPHSHFSTNDELYLYFIKNGKKGMMDISGKTLLPANYTTIKDWNKLDYVIVFEDKLCGIFKISTSELLLKPTDCQLNFTEKGAITGVFPKKEGQFAYWDTIKNKMTFHDFEVVSNFKGGLAIIKSKDEKYGAINEKYKIIIPFQFEYLAEFEQDYTIALTKNSAGHNVRGIVDKKGNWTVLPIYSIIEPLKNSLFWAEKYGIGRIITSNGNVISDSTWTESQIIDREFILVRKNLGDLINVRYEQHFCLLNLEGRIIIDSIKEGFIENGYFFYKSKDLWQEFGAEETKLWHLPKQSFKGKNIFGWQFLFKITQLDKNTLLSCFDSGFYGFFSNEGQCLSAPVKYNSIDFIPETNQFWGVIDQNHSALLDKSGKKLTESRFREAKLQKLPNGKPIGYTAKDYETDDYIFIGLDGKVFADE